MFVAWGRNVNNPLWTFSRKNPENILASSIQSSQLVILPPETYGKLEEECVINFDVDSIDLDHLMERILTTETTDSALLSRSGFMVTIPTWPLGYSCYLFKLREKYVKKNKALLEFNSPIRQKNGLFRFFTIQQCAYRFLIEFSYSSSNLKVILKTSSVGLKKSKQNILSSIIQKFFISRLRREVSLLISRQKIQELQSQKSKIVRKSKRDKDLDKIVHPEKYKLPRPGRKAFSNGSNRLTSRAKQQMQVRKK